MALYTQTGSLQTYGAVEAAGPGVLVPDAQLLFTGDYSRAGSDLVLTGSDGAKFLVTGYFNADAPPSLVSPDGAKLPGDVVMSLAGPQFPGQYAQAGDAPSGKAAIGKVESSSGSASAVRTDGTTVVLKAGDPVFQGDVVLTGPASKLGISFVDGTIFSLSANARMVLNSLVYDPDAGQNNSMLFSLVEGSFVFAAGQIAPTGDMKIQTPVATMGIRGTAPTVNINSETGEVNFSIIADPDDGHVGTYTLYNLDNGLPIGTVSSIGTKWQLTSANGQIVELDKTDTDLLNDANAVGQINNIYTQWQSSTQQNTESPQAGPENNGPPSGGLNTNPQNPDAPGADGNTGNPGNQGQGEGQNNDQSNNQQSNTPPPPPTNTDNDQPPPGPPAPTQASGPNIINGTENLDVLNGTAGDDIINAFGGNDFITANAGDDVVNAGEGNDTIVAGEGEGDDTYDGGAGNDTITYTSTSQGIVINLVDGTVNGSEIGFDTIVNLQNFVAGSGNDTLIIGEDAAITFDGLGGTDTIQFFGNLNIDTSTTLIEADSIEIIDLNKTVENTLTISADDAQNDDETILQIRGGTNADGTTDTVNLTNDFFGGDVPLTGEMAYSVSFDGFDPMPSAGAWQLAEGPPIGIDGLLFDVYEFVDSYGAVLTTAHIEQGIDVNTQAPANDLPAGYTGALGANDSASDTLPVNDANYNSPEPNLSDYWVFYAIAGQEVTVQVGRDESSLDPALWLFNGLIEDPSIFGSQINTGDPGFIDFADDEIPHPGPFGDPTTTFIAPTTGFYTAIVTNFASGADDGDGVFPYTIQVSGNADLPGNHILSEGFENGFAANEWETINATISSDNSTEGGSSALLTTTTGNETDPVNGGDFIPDVESAPLVEDFVRTNAQEVADLAGVPLNQLDALAGDPGFATEGSAIANSFYAMEGQIFSFDWFFSTYEYDEDDFGIVNDFAFVVIDGEVFELFDAEAVGNQTNGMATEGWNSFSIAVDNSGYHDIAFGVLDNEDVEVESSLNIDNLRLESGGDVPHLMGGPGNDILVSGQGQNTITTNAGADRIIFGHINDGIDLITDFGSQDTLDITNLLTVAFDPANVDDFVQARTNGAGDTIISVDIDGPGDLAGPVDIAILQGIAAGISISVNIGDEDTAITSDAIVV